MEKINIVLSFSKYGYLYSFRFVRYQINVKTMVRMSKYAIIGIMLACGSISAVPSRYPK